MCVGVMREGGRPSRENLSRGREERKHKEEVEKDSWERAGKRRDEAWRGERRREVREGEGNQDREKSEGEAVADGGFRRQTLQGISAQHVRKREAQQEQEREFWKVESAQKWCEKAAAETRDSGESGVECFVAICLV